MIDDKDRLNLLNALKNCICGTKVTDNLDINLTLSGRCSVTSLLYPFADYVDTESRRAIASSAELSVNRFYKLSYVARYLIDLLKQNGIKVVLLKGPSTCSYYPIPEYRAFGDVDLLLCDEGDYERADKLLAEHGIVRTVNQDSHHHTSYLYDGVCIELHRKVVRAFARQAVNKRIDALFKLDDGKISYKTIIGCEYPVLTADLELLYMTLHMIEHLCNAGFGIKLLCDYTVALNGNRDGDTIEKLASYAEELGLTTFVLGMVDLSVAYLGLSEEVYLRLTGKSANIELIRLDSNVDELLDEIFDTGLFGKDNRNRIVVPDEAGITGYIKEFHHQMKENFPTTSGIVIIWPLLWLATLINFIKNNKRVRSTGLLNILREADRRGKIIRRMKLWKQ